METNPRTRASGEWLPPPPVVMSRKKRPTPPPLPPAVRRASAEADFEATLGSLVQHFTSLPPAQYGEPPELSSTSKSKRKASAHGYAWWGIGSLVLGATVAGGLITGYQLMRNRRVVPAATAEVPIVVKPAAETKVTPSPATRVAAPDETKPAAPLTEPLAEDKTPQVSPLPDEPSPTAAAVTAPVKKHRPPAKRSHASPVKRAASSSAEPAAAAVRTAGSEEGGWEDPYK